MGGQRRVVAEAVRSLQRPHVAPQMPHGRRLRIDRGHDLIFRVGNERQQALVRDTEARPDPRIVGGPARRGRLRAVHEYHLPRREDGIPTAMRNQCGRAPAIDADEKQFAAGVRGHLLTGAHKAVDRSIELRKSDLAEHREFGTRRKRPFRIAIGVACAKPLDIHVAPERDAGAIAESGQQVVGSENDFRCHTPHPQS